MAVLLQLDGIAIAGVPFLRARVPRQLRGEAGKQIKEGPRAYHDVVNIDEFSHDEHGVAQSLEGRHHASVDLVASHPSVLAHGQLYEEGRNAHHEEHDEVGDEEGAPAVGVGHVGEPPDVAQAHRQAQAGQEELAVVAPTLPLLAAHPVSV